MTLIMKFCIQITFAAILAFSSIKETSGKNILLFWPVSGMSHRISVWPLVEALVNRGHNITFLSPMPSKTPNPKVHEIVLPGDFFSSMGVVDVNDFLETRLSGGPAAITKLWSIYFDFAIKSCEVLLQNQSILNWINSSTYDLVIINAFFNECGYGISYKFKAPYIVYGTVTHWGWFSESFGYPDENYPELMYHYPMDMTFLQSVWNSLQPLYWHLNRHAYMFPNVEAILRKELQIPEMPSLAEMERNTSLVFLNNHFTEEFPRSLPPLVHEIGGMHCTDDIKPLPKDILDFVESGNDGFIYFSFGTFANPKRLSKAQKDIFFNAMGQFKTKFLVKWTDDTSIKLTENVKIVQWVSQQDVLAHPKIRAFISHGGLLGTQEAVFHGVPMIVLPLFADQDFNADRIQDRGRGIMLEIFDLAQDKLENAIREILSNSTYSERSKKVSKLFKDRPSKPVDTALWWVEYVLRHEDTLHLQPIGLSKTWYERRMLHIWGFLALVAFTLFSSIFIITCALLGGFSKNSTLTAKGSTISRKAKKTN